MIIYIIVMKNISLPDIFYFLEGALMSWISTLPLDTNPSVPNLVYL